MKPSICRSALFALVLGAGSAAAATPLTAEQTLNQFNLVVFGDAVSSSHVDGRSYIGGTLTGGDYAQHPSDMPTSAYAGLTVGGNASPLHVNSNGAVIGGNLTGSTINSGSAVVFGNASGVNFNGSAYVAGSSSSNNFNGGIDSALATGAAATAAFSTDFAKTLTGLSKGLSLLKANSDVSVVGNVATFNAVADANGVAIFDLTASVVKAGEFVFNLGSATTIIINSGATSANIAANFTGSGAQAIGAKTLWNFYSATDLTVDRQFGGSILAPLASFTNYNNIEGGVFVDSLTQTGEIHLQPFTGHLPPVPEPETWAMMLCGLAMFGVIARRRRQA